ncbi:MAG: hypothetical protein IKZ46_09800 [Victivallales bacterium]|nr:hypothetical protein [Victivallales bacterium]
MRCRYAMIVSHFVQEHRLWALWSVAWCVPPAHDKSRALPACDGEDAAATPSRLSGELCPTGSRALRAP